MISFRPVLNVLKIIALAAVVMGLQVGFNSEVQADPVTVKATQASNYARLSFRWPQPVGHVAKREGNTLVISFARPIEANLGPAVRRLASVTAIEPAPSNATIILRINGEFTVRSYDSGATVVVDIVGAGQAKASQSVATQGPSVAVRTGVHPTYSRLVFDWPKKPEFSVQRSGDTTTLVFDQAASINLGRLAKGQIRHVNGASSSEANGKLSLSFKIASNSQVKAFASGKKIVMDVFAPKGDKKAAPDPVPVQAQVKAAAVAEPPAPKPAPVAKVEVSKPPAPAPAPAVAENTPAKPVALTPPGGEEPVKKTAVKTQSMSEGIVELRFDWDEPVGAAVFRRSEALWLVFDKKAKFDTAALVRGGKGLVTSVEQVPSNVGAVLRMTTADGINPTIKRAGLSWILEFSRQGLAPNSPLQADAQPDSPLGARLFISVPEPGNVIAFRDPEIGDNLLAVPVIPLSHGLPRQWKYPQLHLLATKQGIVIKPIADDVRVRPLRQGVEITTAGTLQVSRVTAEEKASIELEATRQASSGMIDSGPLSRILDLEKWKRNSLDNFMETRQSLQFEIAKTKSKRTREKARNELMNFYFASGFEAEALGVMETIRSDRPEIENEPEFRLMRGAANWLMERYDLARDDLYHASLDGNDEGTFWRALVVAGEGKMPEVAYELRKVGGIASPYPRSIKMPTALQVAAAAVELGDVKQATQYLEVLRVDGPTRAQKDQINFVAGKLKELSGDVDGAISDWERVMEGVHRPTRAKAAVARTELLLKLELFTAKDAIEEYEKLRFVWRGDDFEFELLRRLGALYLDENMYREGLTALRQAATYFPDHENSDQVTRQMSDAFLQLYMQNGADVLPPVTAIALYDEFRELTPPGAEGDDMIRRLADRLVDIDLLDRAAFLLESQVDFRLTGEKKATVGARLAVIYLLNREYDKALESLDKSEVTKVTDNLLSERILLRAQALIGLKQTGQALEILAPETNLKAEYMRAGIYWRAKQWNEASKAMAQVVRELKTKSRQALNEEQALAVLSVSIAYTLDRNEPAVSLIVANYAEAMLQTQYADAFILITDPPEAGMMNYRGLDGIVQKVASFKGFMDEYKKRVADGQLSSLY